MGETVIRLRDIPEEVNEKLREIAMRDDKFLYDVIRDALIEYVENHQ